jgi:hypothetical protein
MTKEVLKLQESKMKTLGKAAEGREASRVMEHWKLLAKERFRTQNSLNEQPMGFTNASPANNVHSSRVVHTQDHVQRD